MYLLTSLYAVSAAVLFEVEDTSLRTYSGSLTILLYRKLTAAEGVGILHPTPGRSMAFCRKYLAMAHTRCTGAQVVGGVVPAFTVPTIFLSWCTSDVW